MRSRVVRFLRPSTLYCGIYYTFCPCLGNVADRHITQRRPVIPHRICCIIDTLPVSACTGGDVDAVAMAGQVEGL
ncbi:hypothetical protein BDW66DRAFT_141243 [Aspergillus desertorum]